MPESPMSQEIPKPPYESPLIPELLDNDASIQFRCHKGISCYNACCKLADVTLTPYDILRLKKHFGISTTDVLAKYTVPFEMDASGMPGIKLKTQDEEPVCLLMNEEGCSVYENRPSACRYYPVGLMTMRKKDSPVDEHHYCLVKEDHCKGHDEDNKLTIGQYRKEQGVEEYDEMNREWYQVILKKRSSGPAIGKPSTKSFQLFFMCSYDMDRFREFVRAEGFKDIFEIADDEMSRYLSDDYALLKFSFRFLKQVLFGEATIAVKEGAEERRLAQRVELRAKQKARAGQ